MTKLVAAALLLASLLGGCGTMYVRARRPYIVDCGDGSKVVYVDGHYELESDVYEGPPPAGTVIPSQDPPVGQLKP